MGKIVTYDDSKPVKRATVLRIHPDKNGNKFQVVSGVRFGWFSQGIGFTIDVFGWRTRVSFRFEKQFIKLLRYNYHVRWRGYNPPWEYLELHCGVIRLAFGPAYGGWLAE
jgi:hypothetical protein